MQLYNKWKKDMENKLKEGEKFFPASAIKRCPKCQNLSLEFDAATGRIYCTRCGFEENLPIIKNKRGMKI